MDTHEAKAILDQEIAQHCALSREQLVELVNQHRVKEVLGPSGKRYSVELQVLWDDREGGNLRILVSVDDGGVRAFFPATLDFVMAQDGSILA